MPSLMHILRTNKDELFLDCQTDILAACCFGFFGRHDIFRGSYIKVIQVES